MIILKLLLERKGLQIFIPVLLLLLWYRNCDGFPSPTKHAAVSSSASASAITSKRQPLFMSYLDNLSSSQSDKNDNNNDLPPPQQQQQQQSKQNNGGGPKWASVSGGIPTGRGPEASYLQAMTSNNPGAASTNENQDYEKHEEEHEDDLDDDDVTNDVFSKEDRPASWSSEYLTDFLYRDDSRTDVRNLLTQRSIQSFMRLLEECRDPHSAKWIQEDFLQTGNLLDYHGTGAAFIQNFGGYWDSALLEMIQCPKDRIIISAKRRGRGHGGWSKNNPYLKERWVEMPIDIDPASLCDRILSVREQIAKEWVEDLDVLSDANNQILDSYFVNVRARREMDNGQGEAVGGDDDEVAFERTAVNLMNDKSRFSTNLSSSPFRRANFDLLYTLCTQAAIHRILREYISAGEEYAVAFQFLRRFYTDRAVDFFDGYLSFGRADEFIDELLQTAPSLWTTDQGNKQGLADPLGTAETIIRMRNKVATEWKDWMLDVPDAHIRIRQAILSNRMKGQSTGSNFNSNDGMELEGFQ